MELLAKTMSYSKKKRAVVKKREIVLQHNLDELDYKVCNDADLNPHILDQYEAGKNELNSLSKEFFSKPLRWFNEYHKVNVQLSNKQILFNTLDDSLPMQMPNSTQSRLRLLVLPQKKYLYTCKNVVTKPNLD